MPFFTLIVFYAFSALLLGAALGVVLARNTVHSALLLVLAFVASAGLWMLLYAECHRFGFGLCRRGFLFLVVVCCRWNVHKAHASRWFGAHLFGGVVIFNIAAAAQSQNGGGNNRHQ